MSSKWNYVFGAVTIGVIIGGTIYAIKKSKEAEMNEDEVITLEEARKIVKEREKQITHEEEIEVVEEETVKFTSDISFIEEISDDEDENRKPKLVVPGEEDNEDYSYEVDGDPGYDKYENVDERTEGPSLTVEPLNDFSYIEEGIDPKEDKTLRHDPNSPEARHQYIRMELADWRPDHDVYRIMLNLFEVPFVPTNDGDEVLRTQIIDHKVQFYGWNSKWNKEVSFADVIFHYARAAEFNCGESVVYWVEYFLDFNEFDWDTPSQVIDTLVMRLNSHSYFNEERQTFGLFGLSRGSMDQAIRIANQNIDRQVTYEIEFNEFLKSCI